MRGGVLYVDCWLIFVCEGWGVSMTIPPVKRMSSDVNITPTYTYSRMTVPNANSHYTSKQIQVPLTIVIKQPLHVALEWDKGTQCYCILNGHGNHS